MSITSKSIDQYSDRGYAALRNNNNFPKLKSLLEKEMKKLKVKYPEIDQNNNQKSDATSDLNVIIDLARTQFPKESKILELKTVSTFFPSIYDKDNAYNKLKGAIDAIHFNHIRNNLDLYSEKATMPANLDLKKSSSNKKSFLHYNMMENHGQNLLNLLAIKTLKKIDGDSYHLLNGVKQIIAKVQHSIEDDTLIAKYIPIKSNETPNIKKLEKDEYFVAHNLDDNSYEISYTFGNPDNLQSEYLLKIEQLNNLLCE